MNFSKKITHWYSEHKRNLPWRTTKNPYFIWLSEIILQQTQIKQGLPYYELFITHFPTVFDLAKASEEQVLKLWQGLGYYSRARNLHYTAKYVVEHLNGNFPDTYKGLIRLRGIGDYTASAIASICFDEKCASVDGNVYRVLSRLYGIDTPINTSLGIKQFKNLAQELLPENNIGDFNQALMEFGATQCKPKSPNCKSCLFNNSCVGLQTNKVNSLPVKNRKLKIRNRYINYLVYRTPKNDTLFFKQENKGIWKNLYQFPLIETDKPSKKHRIINEIKKNDPIKNESFSIRLYNNEEIIHKLSHQHLHVKFWIIDLRELPCESINFNEIKRFPVPVLISNFIDEFKF